MNTYHIWVNKLPYMGEDPERTYSSGETWSNASFHTRRTEVNLLIFDKVGGKPKSIVGSKCLKSELDRILRRSEDGLLNIFEIRITSEDENNDNSTP